MDDVDSSPSTSHAIRKRPNAGLCRLLLIRAAAPSTAAVAIPAEAAIAQPRPR
jgi:hypothetical protein